MPILTKKRCKQQFSIDTNSLEDYLCLFFSFMMTFHVMDNDCHTKLTAQSCNTTMTQNRKCENTKSKSARLLLTTCNSSFVIIEPRECVNSFSYILFLLTINRSKLCFVFCDALFRLHCLLRQPHAPAFCPAWSSSCYSENTGFIWAVPVNWRYQMFFFSWAAPVYWPCR